jgi:hypothetical protein
MNFVGDALLAHANGGCYRCLRGDNLVDLDVQIVGEGILAICTGCLKEAAEAAGIHLNEAAVAEERAAHQEAARRFDPEAVEALEAELAEARSALQNEQVTVHNLQDALSRVGKERKPAPHGGSR